jgi:hypothetical protein
MSNGNGAISKTSNFAKLWRKFKPSIRVSSVSAGSDHQRCGLHFSEAAVEKMSIVTDVTD